MRLIATADLHINHPRGRALAMDAIEQINRTSGDVLLIVGDTATAEGDDLEKALSAIRFDGPKLFVAGNHELWTTRADSHAIFTKELPDRVRALGWQWLETEPFIRDGVAIVGSIGWYDYSYAPSALNVPVRFFEAKISPGAAGRLSQFAPLLGADVPPSAMEIVARWNDGKHVKLGRSDAAFLQERLERLEQSLKEIRAQRIVAAVHHVPFEALLPPRRSAMWDFVRAYLGSERIGQMLLKDERITHVLCGHSHFAADVQIGTLRAINIGSGYREKHVLTLDV